MPEDLAKLDRALTLAFLAWKEDQTDDANAGISVTLTFEGSLSAIEALGFETHSVWENEAIGVVYFKDVAALSESPSVLWMAAGQEPQRRLDTAVRDGRVRASDPAKVGAGGDGVWHAVVASGALTAPADSTGKDVIVAIIDTGIDYTHPMFMSQLTPTKKTRIKRIWDQGLSPASVNDCPKTSLITSAPSYGVEYDDTEIEAALNGGAPLDHKDCVGHGTHVAGIAAGGVIFAPGGDAKRVGVAPEADIIAVKLLDNPEKIKFRLAAGFGADVGWDRRFKDAVLYCLRTAKNELANKPVVINMSFGNAMAPGDALDADARWVDALMDPSQAADDKHFPTRAVIVKAAGNDGRISARQVAVIRFPAAGQITVPLLLEDTRGAMQVKYKNCNWRLYPDDAEVYFWYRRANNFHDVKFAVRLPDQAAFSSDMEVGGWTYTGFVHNIGPPPSITLTGISDNVNKLYVKHGGEPAVPYPGPGSHTVRRHAAYLQITPKQVGGVVSYPAGIYEMRITAPAGTEVFVMCSVEFLAKDKKVAFGIAPTMQNGSALDANIDVTPEFSATDTLGKHAITVAAYDDTDGDAAKPEHHALAAFSSRGPLRDFSNPPGSLQLIAKKPDVAAPGVHIESAQSVDMSVALPIRVPDWLAGKRFVHFQGTSMSAPFMAGVIALMLDKNPNLSTADVISKLAARPGAKPASPPAAHQNAYGIGMIDGLKSHLNAP